MAALDWRTEQLTSARSVDAAALYRLSFPQPWERPWSGDELSALLATPGCFGHLLIDGESDLACGLIVLRAAADEAEILTIGVVPAHRRRHGAVRLLERAIEDCSARGVYVIFLDVADDNEPARRFYQRAGFAVIGTRPAYYARGAASAVTALTMSRPI